MSIWPTDRHWSLMINNERSMCIRFKMRIPARRQSTIVGMEGEVGKLIKTIINQSINPNLAQVSAENHRKVEEVPLVRWYSTQSRTES